MLVGLVPNGDKSTLLNITDTFDVFSYDFQHISLNIFVFLSLNSMMEKIEDHQGLKTH